MATRTSVVPLGAPRPARRGRSARARRRSGRRPVETLVDRRRPALAGCTRTPTYRRGRRAVPRAASSAGRSPRRPPRDAAAATPPSGSRTREPRFAAVERTPGGFRTLARVALPGATSAGRSRPPAIGAAAAATGRRADADDRRASSRDRAATMAVWEAIARRSAPSAASPTGPSTPTHLDRILHAGRRADQLEEPAALGVHRLPRPGHLRELAAVGPWAGHLAGRGRRDRPRHAGPDGAPTRRCRCMFDLGQAADSMMLAAWELGIGSVPGDGLRARPRAAARSAIPADHHCEFLLSFGYPADPTDLTRPLTGPAAGGPSTRSSTRSAGSGHADRSVAATASGTSRRDPEADDEPADEDGRADPQRREGAPPTMTWRSASDR